MKIKDLTVERVKLEEPLELRATPGIERYVHPLIGKVKTGLAMGRRGTVFSPPGAGLYIGPGYEGSIVPDGPLDLLIASAAGCTPGRASAQLVQPVEHEIGEGNYKRTVYEILGGDGPAQRLRCGETLNVKGGWSSWPPHSFDMQPSLAPQFEEVFVAFMRPRNGYALIRRKGTWNDGGEVDDSLIVYSGDMFAVPLGSHPIVGSPETELMYVWFYLSPVSKKYGRWAEDVGGYQ